ncbi:hypothetical protein [Bradyrhizobium canariense]|uniref:hypothetical protein n=1 Tax=Bradyrhizobium canariense TaxID=255045 RepID=UPI0011BA6605|nr:hypothetical protein [Bradyrhizobium canariense]
MEITVTIFVKVALSCVQRKHFFRDNPSRLLATLLHSSGRIEKLYSRKGAVDQGPQPTLSMQYSAARAPNGFFAPQQGNPKIPEERGGFGDAGTSHAHRLDVRLSAVLTGVPKLPTGAMSRKLIPFKLPPPV